MTTAYIVGAKGWEYNDEYYYEGSGSHPIKVFRDRELAEQFKLNKEIECVQGTDYIEYNNDIEENLTCSLEEFNKTMKQICESNNKKWNDWEDGENARIPSGLSRQSYEKILDLLTVEFYELFEVEE